MASIAQGDWFSQYNGLHWDPKWQRHKMVRVSGQCLRALRPWRERAYLIAGSPLGRIASRWEVVETDAFLSGRGAVRQCWTVRGQWDAQHRLEHINVLELLAMFSALRHFLPVLRN